MKHKKYKKQLPKFELGIGTNYLLQAIYWVSQKFDPFCI